MARQAYRCAFSLPPTPLLRGHEAAGCVTREQQKGRTQSTEAIPHLQSGVPQTPVRPEFVKRQEGLIDDEDDEENDDNDGNRARVLVSLCDFPA